MIEAAKITKILIFENKKQVLRSSHSNKRRSKNCWVLISKRLIKGERYITPMDFAEHLRKFVMVNSYKMDFFMEGNVRLVKVDEMYNIL